MPVVLFVQSLLHYPVVRGALTGWLGAAVADYAAFRSWKSWHDVVDYDWGVATWRWLQGAVGGALAGAGLGVVS